ncbi:thiamine pyrophosphate-dependent dehydrogenase E1 component subunit alpha [Pseudacidovorax intermedius]|uniref:thiamine pyrophosphate-dependent dehydrogenase E1 component subunit alpha n=1 Tax=Pseudacidovorax intermedius TaxID=433924 RepID=UPI0026F1F7BC|nr:thiamine pyrophosphate-dependent dehydrogenase E1 component subunit alpha [Pseudacidovorax intermedius]
MTTPSVQGGAVGAEGVPRVFERFSVEQLHGFLRQMHLIRQFEEGAEQAYMRGLVHGTMHLSIGQEASATGVGAALREGDVITSTHRGHGHCIAKGADPKFMFAEFFGKDTGYCRGRGGSMHIADVASGNLGANGIVGGGLPIAVGAALALRQQGKPNVAVCFFGDGANNEGAFHESLNMAAVWKLPVVFVCENNQYGMSTSTERSTAVRRIAQRAQAYDFPGVTVDGNEFAAVAEAAIEAVERARSGQGPTLLECLTYRHRGHSKSDRNRYRTKEEIESWIARDPIGRYEQALQSCGLITPEQVSALVDDVAREIAEAVEYAKNSPAPDAASVTDFVYTRSPKEAAHVR